VTDLFPRVVRTERLRFERFRPSLLDALDRDALYRYYATEDGIEDATAMMTWSPHAHPRETVETMGMLADAEGEAVYAVFPREDLDADQDPEGVDPSALDAADFAGTAGIHPDWERRLSGFGMWLRKPYWGRGYSGERADAFVELAFDRLDVEAVAVETYPSNEQSRRAIEKYVDRWGGSFQGAFRHLKATDGPQDVRRYVVDRADYDAATADGRPPGARAIEVFE
jgi:ribosomal-protein-alanine N-acetyltransferase